ncbi:MAG: saccharopine dehydrogenase NADP-binding domain-containing protein [Myxococcota bacterium]
MSDRPYDVVVFGATGFTGRLVADYLANRHPVPGLTWAIAGRNGAKLEKVAAELGIDGIPQIVADSADRESLDALTRQTKVVCTTVGPYAKYGAPLVASCVAQGTHYVDLTGEPQFIRRMIDEHHEAAAENGTRIVHCCGFDSIPSDLGVFNLQQAAIDRLGAPFDEVEAVVLGASGGFSGGTAASMIEMMEEATDKSVRRVLGDPYSLAGGKRGPDQGEQRGARYSEALGAWTGPFIMATVNEKVVRRSNAILDDRYGAGFRYGESMRTGAGLQGRIAANALAGGLTAAVVGLAVPPLRQLAQSQLLPAPGEGPTPKQIAEGFFKFRMFGRYDDRPERAQITVTGTRDPGYGATSCMLAQSAVTLAKEPNLPLGGVLTPASAMGASLTERLQATDVQFEVEWS